MKRVCNTCHNVKGIENFEGDNYRCSVCRSLYDDPKSDPSEYVRNRRKVDPLFKLKMDILSKTNSALKSSYWLRNSNNEKMLGADRDTVIKYIESKFKEGMAWSNRALWHIDHVVPLSSAKTEAQLYSLANYKNLSPEWKGVNLRKSDKIPKEVLRIGNEREKASELVSWYFFNVDCSMEMAKRCAINTIDFMLNNSSGDNEYFSKVKEIIINEEIYLNL
jgi:hypothetical protein